MISIEEARMLQNKTQKKCIIIFVLSLLLLSGVCFGLFFVGKREFYVGLYVSLFVLIYVCYKIKITDFFRKKEYEGEVTYFNVRRERVKETNTHQAGSKYLTYDVMFADVIIKDKNGKCRHKTFRFNKEYDNVKAGDRATVLRFVDKPIIEFQKQ